MECDTILKSDVEQTENSQTYLLKSLIV